LSVRLIYSFYASKVQDLKVLYSSAERLEWGWSTSDSLFLIMCLMIKKVITATTHCKRTCSFGGRVKNLEYRPRGRRRRLNRQDPLVLFITCNEHVRTTCLVSRMFVANVVAHYMTTTVWNLRLPTVRSFHTAAH
jgi:hypothetical protein